MMNRSALRTILAMAVLSVASVSLVRSQTPNAIDGINSAADIERLVASVDKSFADFKVNQTMTFDTDARCQALSDSLKAKAWTKVDLDGDGHTDLLVNGRSGGYPASLVIMDMGDHYDLSRIRTSADCRVPVVDTRGKDTVIAVHSLSAGTDQNGKPYPPPPPELLTFKYVDLVELNAAPTKHKIAKIEYKTTQCFGTCASFDLTIAAGGSVIFHPIRFNTKDIHGITEGRTYQASISKAKFDEIASLADYIDFPNLKASYAVPWTDDQTSFLTITYDNGKVKKIQDYGMQGTYGLRAMYVELWALRGRSVWK